MNLVAVSGVTIGDAQGLGTITEDDPQPSITVDDPTVAGERRDDDVHDLSG